MPGDGSGVCGVLVELVVVVVVELVDGVIVVVVVAASTAHQVPPQGYGQSHTYCFELAPLQ